MTIFLILKHFNILSLLTVRHGTKIHLGLYEASTVLFMTIIGLFLYGSYKLLPVSKKPVKLTVLLFKKVILHL